MKDVLQTLIYVAHLCLECILAFVKCCKGEMWTFLWHLVVSRDGYR